MAIIRGRAGLQTAQQVREAQRSNRGKPFRLWLKQGETTDVIVLDTSLNDVAFLWEHVIPGPGMDWKRRQEIVCIKDKENCPLCELAEQDSNGRFKPSTFVMVLTVLDLRPWKDKEGKKHHYSKRLLVVKNSQIPDFAAVLEPVEKKEGRIRGCQLRLSRANDSNSPAVGKPVPNDEAQVYEMWTEKELIAEFGHPAVKGDDGKVVKPENADIMPVDYEEVFQEPDADELRRRFGVPGDSPASAWEEKDDEDDAPPPRRGRFRAETEDAPDDDEPPARSRRRRRLADDLDDDVPWE